MLKMWHMHEPGERVALMSHTDWWMQGERYGTVTKIGTKWLHVQMDSGRKRRFLIQGRDGFAPHVPELKTVKRSDT